MIYNSNIRIRRIVKIIINNLFALHIFFSFQIYQKWPKHHNVESLWVVDFVICHIYLCSGTNRKWGSHFFSHCQGNVLHCFRLKQNFSHKNLTYSLFFKVKIWWTTIIMSTFRLCALRLRPFFTISSWLPSSVCWELASITSCVYQSRPTPCVWQTILDLSLESIGSW